MNASRQRCSSLLNYILLLIPAITRLVIDRIRSIGFAIIITGNIITSTKCQIMTMNRLIELTNLILSNRLACATTYNQLRFKLLDSLFVLFEFKFTHILFILKCLVFQFCSFKSLIVDFLLNLEILHLFFHLNLLVCKRLD